MNFAFGIILDRDRGACLLGRRDATEHVKQKFVVDLYERNLDSDLGVETAANLLKDFVDCTGDQASVFIVSGATGHSERFSSASLPVAKYSAIIAVDN